MSHFREVIEIWLDIAADNDREETVAEYALADEIRDRIRAILAEPRYERLRGRVDPS